MKKQNENKNESINNVVADFNAEQYVNDNITLVPNVMRSRFDKLPLEEKVQKINNYIERKKKQEANKKKNRLVNKVKDLFDRRHASVQEANDVADFCNEYINSFKRKEIDRLDDQIKKLQELKAALVG